MFFLISGAAASGKSTVAMHLPILITNIECHDYDERIVTNVYTRCQQLEEWIQLALIKQQKGGDFLLTSHSPLGELLACPSARKLSGISACLLDCHDTVRIQRMRNRGLDPKWPPSQDTLNWAAWHRMHAWDPQWEQHVITSNGPANHSYSRWTGWKQNDARWKVTIIDTTPMPIKSMLDTIVAWTKSAQNSILPLSIETLWWE